MGFRIWEGIGHGAEDRDSSVGAAFCRDLDCDFYGFYGFYGFYDFYDLNDCYDLNE
ncbi:MAG: hypothetical protein JRD00_11475 [Deltaproteobacteria bacterium]|nr:hypothetical protein [Deltaproteobacteria bacterium]